MKNSISNSREGFSALEWGPGLWKFIHMAALNIKQNPTEAEIQSHLTFFDSLRNVLPCGVCRREYRKLITSGPLRLTPELFRTRRRAFKWTVDIHDAVSARLGRPVNKSRDWAATYERLRHKNVRNSTTNRLSDWNSYDAVVNYTQSSRPTAVYLAPRHMFGYSPAAHRGRIASVTRQMKEAFGSSVRLLIMDAVKFRQLSPVASAHKNRYPADSFVVFQDGRETTRAGSFPQLVATMRTML